MLNESFDGQLTEETKWGLLDEHNHLEFTPKTIHFTAANGSYFPYLFTPNQIFPQSEDFVLEIRFKYDGGYENYGSGFCIAQTVFMSRISSPPSGVCTFGIWTHPNSFAINADIPSNNPSCPDGCNFYYAYGSEVSQWHTLKIELIQNIYKIYVNEQLKFESLPTEFRPKYIWLGNPEIPNNAGIVWAKFEVDYLKINPNQQIKYPLILLPGLGASWNTNAIAYDQQVAPQDWKMTPFVNTYQNIIEAIDNTSEYELDDNFFIWNYDWRQPIKKTAEDLDNFILSNEALNSSAKINFIGHSLGGLVARTWAENYDPLNERINKLITVGSPHRGAVQAYEALAGGKITDRINLGWIAGQLLIQIKRHDFETSADILRNVAPVLYDLAPAFNFIRKDDQVVNHQNLYFFNDWLWDLNQTPTSTSSSEYLLGNNGVNTPEWLNLKRTSILHKILNLWPDGDLVSIDHGEGDETVLKKSAYISESYNPQLEFPLNHRQIISQNEPVKKIFEILELPPPSLAANQTYSPENLLIFYLASPAKLSVDGQTSLDDNLQFIVIPDPEAKIYQAKVSPLNDGGNYRLFVGQLTTRGNFWQTYEGQVSSNKINNYSFQIDFDNPLPEPLLDPDNNLQITRVKFLLSKLSQNNRNSFLNIASKFLDQFEKALNKKKLDQASLEVKKIIFSLSRFRKSQDLSVNEYHQAGELMFILRSLWEKIISENDLASQKSALRQYKQANNFYSHASRQNLEVASKLKALSLKQAEEILPEVEQSKGKKDYASLETKSYLFYLFSWESL